MTDSVSDPVVPQKRRIWALPIRLFHWSLAVCVIAAWLLGENLSFDNVQLHFTLGYVVAGLVAFRLLWGLVASGPTSLRALLPSPRSVLRYAAHARRREPSYWPGHNPMGALSVLALLVSLIVQIVTGLFSYSDEVYAGGPLIIPGEYDPSAYTPMYIDQSTQMLLQAIHHLNSKILLLLVILHVGAVLYYMIWKHENLIRPMLTGWKDCRDPDESAD